MRRMAAAARVAAIGLAGLATAGLDARRREPVGPTAAVAPVRDAAGRTIGRATAIEVPEGLRISLDLTGLSPGHHGVHLHTFGRCDGAGYANAGPDWTPPPPRRSRPNARNPVASELPNLIVGTDRRGTLAATIPDATLGTLVDADGAALIVYADPADPLIDAAGQGGARLACGVFTPV